MTTDRWLCVFCGSPPGRVDGVQVLARGRGAALADAGVGLVFGGSGTGVMGSLADAVLDGGGRVVGVMPAGVFGEEVPHRGLTEMIETADMHDRKRTMYDRADAFCALPGGYGTLDEVFEAATWSQLGIHDRPKTVVLLDHDGFWHHLERFLDQAVTSGFVTEQNRRLVRRVDSVDQVLTAMT